MRCLLDKVTARFAMQGLVKLTKSPILQVDEVFALDLISIAGLPNHHLFIAPPTANVLKKIARLPEYSDTIEFFLNQVQVIKPARYFKRWARRLRNQGFTREDAAVLALATFGTDQDDAVLSMDYVATFDGPMINHWITRQTTIQARLTAMRADIPAPYNQALIPQVLRPQEIIL